MREYATQMEAAKQGIITPEMKTVAEKEFTDPEIIRERVALGQIAIPANINHKSLCAEGIGKGLRTKINVNLGISGDANNYEAEMDKVRMALRFGAEAIMDLSNYGKTNTFRQQLIELSPAMIGTVPMYDAIGYLEKDLLDITAQDFLKVVRAHAEEGVDFMTIHAGINRRAVEAFKRDKRKMNIVSRGGSLLFAWMEMTGQENPFYEYYDAVLDILREYDVTISLGDALRPGCLDDSTDAGQIAEPFVSFIFSNGVSVRYLIISNRQFEFVYPRDEHTIRGYSEGLRVCLFLQCDLHRERLSCRRYGLF